MSGSNYFVETEGILGELWDQIKKEKYPPMREVLLKSYCILLTRMYRSEKEMKGGEAMKKIYPKMD